MIFSHSRVPRTVVALGAATFLGLSAPQAFAEDTCAVADSYHIEKGHQDVAVRDDDGPLRFTVDDDSSGEHVERDSRDFVVVVDDNMTGSLDELGFPGISGDAWLLPQDQDYSRPWFGFSLLHLSNMTEDETAQLSMELHDAPEGGRVVAWLNGDGGEPPELELDSEDPSMTWEYPRSHKHPNFGFTQPGAYAITFTFTLPDGSEHSLDAPFLVGNSTDESELCELDWGDSSAGNSGPKSKAGQLTSDINDTAKAIGTLDKALDKTLDEADKMVATEAPKAKSDKSKTESKNKTEQKDKDKAKDKNKDKSKAKDTTKAQTEKKAANPQPQSTPGGTVMGSKPAVRSANTAGSTNTGTKSAPSKSEQKETEKKKKASASAHRPGRGNSLATEDGQGYVETDAQELSYGVPMLNFWAGVLSGIGAFALLLGTGLFIWAQFFRKPKHNQSQELGQTQQIL